MRKLTLLILFCSALLTAQSDASFTDDKYLEDQLYLQLSYISILDTPSNISQSGFSFGLGGGFIKDIPLNKRRNVGLGAGLGYVFNNYYFNVRFQPVSVEGESVVVNNTARLHLVELPIEIRFRGSTADRYKFWRVYPGFKMSYVFWDNLSLGKKEGYDVGEVIQYTDFQYGLTLSAGYNKWNVHMYYGLNDVFTSKPAYSPPFAIGEFRIGLIFYVF